MSSPLSPVSPTGWLPSTSEPCARTASSKPTTPRSTACGPRPPTASVARSLRSSPPRHPCPTTSDPRALRDANTVRVPTRRTLRRRPAAGSRRVPRRRSGRLSRTQRSTDPRAESQPNSRPARLRSLGSPEPGTPLRYRRTLASDVTTPGDAAGGFAPKLLASGS